MAVLWLCAAVHVCGQSPSPWPSSRRDEGRYGATVRDLARKTSTSPPDDLQAPLFSAKEDGFSGFQDGEPGGHNCGFHLGRVFGAAYLERQCDGCLCQRQPWPGAFVRDLMDIGPMRNDTTDQTL